MSRLRFKRADGLDFGDSISLCLGDVAEYRKSRRVAQEVVYVSTEDLLKDIEGISKRELTEAEGVEFFKGDILLGNIRPYLKKLYLSKYLSRVNKHIWRDKWGILKTYVTA